MVDDSKKLVRGLKDISPLFGATVSGETPVHRSPEVQVLGVSSPDCEGDSLLLNTFFASQIASPDKACSLISILSRHAAASPGSGKVPESFGDHLDRYCLYWDELRDLISGPSLPRAEGMLQSRDVFLDFEYRHLLHFERAISLLDKWVLLLKPTAESLTEGYKMMKVGLALNPQLEFYITLSGKAEEAKGTMIFDRFSDFALRHLEAQLGWLGWMDLADPSSHFSAALCTEPLKYQQWNAKPTLQKFMLAGWIESSEKKIPAGVLAEALR